LGFAREINTSAQINLQQKYLARKIYKGLTEFLRHSRAGGNLSLTTAQIPFSKGMTANRTRY
jgi:hypothetical protein